MQHCNDCHLYNFSAIGLTMDDVGVEPGKHEADVGVVSTYKMFTLMNPFFYSTCYSV